MKCRRMGNDGNPVDTPLNDSSTDLSNERNDRTDRLDLAQHIEPVDDFASFGMTAFTTRRSAGTFGLAGTDPVGEVMARWSALGTALGTLTGTNVHGIAIAPQVHGTTVLAHDGQWTGLLRTPPADGHATQARGVALTVTIADCVPIFLAHPSGAIAMLHSGWKGTAGKILHEGIRVLARAGLAPDELSMHLGPAICGRCYEVSADVREQLTGEPATRPGQVDLRSLILDQAKEAGIQRVTVSPWCTRCDNDRFFSHRAGDTGRQLAVIVR